MNTPSLVMMSCRLFTYMLISAFISGCFVAPISRNDVESKNNKTLVKTLIGESQESIIATLGLPEKILADGERRFMFYSDRSRSKGVPFLFFLPLPMVIDAGEVLHCFRLELDSNNLVKDYDIKSTTRSAQKGCLNQFWNERKSLTLKELPLPELDYQPQNVVQQPQIDHSLINCISGGIRQCVERSQCDRSTARSNSSLDTVSCFSCGKRQWVERSQCD